MGIPLRAKKTRQAGSNEEEAMASEDDDKPRKKVSHEIGQDLSLLSVDDAANSFFKS